VEYAVNVRLKLSGGVFGFLHFQHDKGACIIPLSDMSGGLPYDATPPPSPPKISDDPLDRPLEDYAPSEEVPDHVRSLMGRMSKGKVYLLEETPAILHVDGESRVRGDPVRPYPLIPQKHVLTGQSG